jgi:hypothetical protein
MKRLITLLSLFLFSVTSFADGENPLPIKGILGMEAGDYSFVTYDKGKLQDKYLSILEERSHADKDYFLRAVSQVEQAFIDFVSTTIYGQPELAEGEPKPEGDARFEYLGLKRLSDYAKGSGEFYPAKNFLDAINEYQLGVLALKTKIKTLTSIAEGAFPSQIEATADGSGLDNIPNYGNIDFSVIKKFYEDRLSEITKYASDLQHNVILANGNEHIIPANQGKGLVLVDASVLLSPAKIREMQEKIFEYLMWDDEAEDKINDYTTRVKRLIQRFVTEYGVNETYRPRTDGDIAARNEAFREIVIAFWTRSYLRVAYGVPLGTIGITYEKSWAKLDRFMVSNTALRTFREEPVWEQEDLMSAAEAYRNALTVVDARSSKVMDGDTSLLTKANSLITFITGQRPVAEILEMVLQLMAADCYEEKTLITESGALALLFSRYEARYFTTEDSEAKFRALRKSYDPDPVEAADPDADEPEDNPFGDTDVLSAGSIRAEFSNVLLEAQLKQTELQLAQELRGTIANAVRANAFTRRVDGRKKKL